MKKEELAAMIDHTILKTEAAAAEIEKVCNEAVEYRFCSACVQSCWVSFARRLLDGSGVKLCSVVGFPQGLMVTAAKEEEARIACGEGAAEIDMVINVGFLKSGKFAEVERDIAAVKRGCRGGILKVIFENCLLTDGEKIRACELSVQGGADFVKTSTGFSSGGALEKDLILMKKHIPPSMGLKAAGGIRTYDDVMRMINAGATRIGTSGGVGILKSVPV
ncbi:MAG: deoxyribose-phosphate aldolase [Treponema sp.]|jgi:deoxyribose-phosphate aldolase|nr:deoxyribose-phosphate aldolase [Treponema sp.]